MIRYIIYTPFLFVMSARCVMNQHTTVPFLRAAFNAMPLVNRSMQIYVSVSCNPRVMGSEDNEK